MRRTAMGLVVFALSYATAFMETLTIAHVSAWGPGARGLVIWGNGKRAGEGSAGGLRL